MDIKINKNFTKKFGSKLINRQYFHRKTSRKTFFVSFEQLKKIKIKLKLKLKKYYVKFTRYYAQIFFRP